MKFELDREVVEFLGAAASSGFLAGWWESTHSPVLLGLTVFASLCTLGFIS